MKVFAVFGENPLLHVLILAKPVLRINETLFLGLQTHHPHNVACLQNGDLFIIKTGFVIFGTTNITILICCMSPFRQIIYSENKNVHLLDCHK